jgi:hypothetical protein
LNYRKYLAGISIPPAEVITWQDKSGNNNHLLPQPKKGGINGFLSYRAMLLNIIPSR